jgi:RHS repeat-associated protein
VKKSTGTLYWYGGGSDVLLETDLSGGLLNEYIFFGGKRVARRDAAGNVFYYFADHLGSSRVITNATGTVCYEADFYPYGGERAVTTTCSQNYKFTGKERDTETGNDNFGARYYPNNLGRFLTPDPLMASGRASNPQTWNRYAYTLNNPLRFIDPNGLQEQPCATTDQECEKRRLAAKGKGKVTVTAGITTLEPVTSDDRQAQKQKQPQETSVTPEQKKKMIAVVYSEKDTATVKESEAIASTIINRASSGDKQYVDRGEDVNIDNVLTHKPGYKGVNGRQYEEVMTGAVTPKDAQTGVENVLETGVTTNGTFMVVRPGGAAPTAADLRALGNVTPATPAQIGDVYLYIPK